jgi:hypothetical protein
MAESYFSQRIVASSMSFAVLRQVAQRRRDEVLGM